MVWLGSHFMVEDQPGEELGSPSFSWIAKPILSTLVVNVLEETREIL